MSKKLMFREVYVLREVKIDPNKLRKGDVFRMSRAYEGDVIDENEYYICQAKPKKTETKGDLQFNCKVLLPSNIAKTLNFVWSKGRKK